MKNLGKIIYFIFFLGLMAHAQVDVSVDKDQVSRGERVTFTLRLTGNQVVDLPPISTLCGYDIEGRMQSQKTVISNGKRAQELSMQYTFMPERSCRIEPLRMKVDGNEEQTEAIEITVSKVSIAKNDPFVVELKTDKNAVYVGEPFEMYVNFKQRRGIGVYDQSVSLPESKNIWIKSQYEGRAVKQDRYETHENMYAISAQQSGKLNLGPLRWNLQVQANSRDSWGMLFSRIKTHTVFSNEVDIEVKPLPEGVILVGDLQLKAEVDKTEVNAGEAVNLTITAEGRANVEDIPAFDLFLQGAQAFKEEPKVTHALKDNQYFGAFSQKLAIVAEKDFTIEALTLTYMDVATDQVKTIKTQPISIKVINAKASESEPLKVIKASDELTPPAQMQAKGLNTLDAIVVFAVGLLSGVILMMIPWRRFKQNNTHANKFKPGINKQTLQQLIPHVHEHEEIATMVQNLSENLYEGKSHSIDLKHLKALMEKIHKADKA